MTRGVADTTANLYVISYCLSTFYTLFYWKLWKNLTSCAFPVEKYEKNYLEFLANEKFLRIIHLWLYVMGLSRLGTWLVVLFFDVHVPPCVQRYGVNTPFHFDMWPGFVIIMSSYVLFVELKVFQSRNGQFSSLAEPCSYMQFLCARFHNITIMQAVLWLDLWTGLCLDSRPIK